MGVNKFHAHTKKAGKIILLNTLIGIFLADVKTEDSGVPGQRI